MFIWIQKYDRKLIIKGEAMEEPVPESTPENKVGLPYQSGCIWMFSFLIVAFWGNCNYPAIQFIIIKAKV